MEQVQKLVTLPRYSFELRVERDDGLAQMYYQDFLENAGGDCEVSIVTSFSKTSLYIIGDHEAKAFTASQLRKMRKAELADICRIVCDYCIDENDYNREELIGKIYNMTLACYYEKLWLAGDFGEVPYRKAFGYNQSDFARFVTIGDCARWVTEEYIQNLFYNCPMYARLNVVDSLTDEEEEIDLTEFLSCTYEWDKEKVLDHLREYRSDWWLYAVEYCEENLEDYY